MDRRDMLKQMPYEERRAFLKEEARIRSWNAKHRPKVSTGVYYLATIIIVLTAISWAASF